MKIALHNYLFYLVALTPSLSCVGAGIGNQARTASDVLKDFSAWVSSGNQPEKYLRRKILEEIIIEKRNYQISAQWTKADRGFTSNAVAYEAYNNGKEFSAWMCIQYLLKEGKNIVYPSLETTIFTLDDILKGAVAGLDGAQDGINNLKNENLLGEYYTSFIANTNYSFVKESVYLNALYPKLKLLEAYLQTYSSMTTSELKGNIKSRKGKLIVRIIKRRLETTLPVVRSLIAQLERPESMERLQQTFHKAIPLLKRFQDKKNLLPTLGSALENTDILKTPTEFNKRRDAVLQAFDKRIRNRSALFTTRGSAIPVNPTNPPTISPTYLPTLVPTKYPIAAVSLAQDNSSLNTTTINAIIISVSIFGTVCMVGCFTVAIYFLKNNKTQNKAPMEDTIQLGSTSTIEKSQENTSNDGNSVQVPLTSSDQQESSQQKATKKSINDSARIEE